MLTSKPHPPVCSLERLLRWSCKYLCLDLRNQLVKSGETHLALLPILGCFHTNSERMRGGIE
jgi:hypothetical protein